MALHLAKGKREKKSCREPSIRRPCPGQSGAERGSSSRRGDTSDVKRVQVWPPLTVPSFSQSGQEPYSSGIRRPCHGQWGIVAKNSESQRHVIRRKASPGQVGHLSIEFERNLTLRLWALSDSDQLSTALPSHRLLLL
jgi:hypothetical protein